MQVFKISTILALTAISSAIAAPGHQRPAGGAPGQNQITQMDKFCGAFIPACTNICLEKQTGEHTVAYHCSKVPPKNEIYHFGCHCDGTDRTQGALNKIGSGPSASVTSVTVTTTAPSTTETQHEKVTHTLTESTLSIDPAQTPVVAQLLAELIPQLQVKVPKHKKKTNGTNPLTNKAVSKAAANGNETSTPMNNQTTSPFCIRYGESCSRECARVSSKPKTTTCAKTSDGQDDDTYDLLCSCENDKLETQHAFAGIASDPDASDDDQEVTTSTVSVNGTTSVATQTSMQKSASVIGTSTSTTTLTTTKTKGTSTVTATSTSQVTTTTVIAVAPTGRIRVDQGDKVKGYLGTTDKLGSPLTFKDASAEYDVVIYKSPSFNNVSSPYYSFALLSNPLLVLGLENVFPGKGDFSLDGKDNAFGTLQSMMLPVLQPNAKGDQGGPLESDIWGLGSPAENKVNKDRKTQVPLDIKWKNQNDKKGDIPGLKSFGENDKMFIETDPVGRYFGDAALNLYFEPAP